MAGFTLRTEETTALRGAVDVCAHGRGEEPLPWELLDAIVALVPCDVLAVSGIDVINQTEYLGQTLMGSSRHWDGRAWAASEPVPDDHFFSLYWSSPPCSYPDQSGDLQSVTTVSDFYTDRQWKAHPMRRELMPEISREAMVCLADGPGRTLRLLLVRSSGADFTDRQRFLLALLRPHIADCYRRWRAPSPEPVDLTARQRELVVHMAAGLSNREIARRLGVSEGTVRAHLNNIYRRLGVTNRTAAVMRVLGNT